MILPRRSFLTGLASFIAAPAIVRAASLMPVRGIVQDWRYVAHVAHLDYLELAAITRKAFLPGLFVQLYETAPIYPLLRSSLSSGSIPPCSSPS